MRCAGWLIAACCAPPWMPANVAVGQMQPFASPDGKFEMSMPGPAVTREEKNDAGNVITTHRVDKSGIVYLMSYFDTQVPAVEWVGDRQDRISAARDRLLKDKGGTLRRDHWIQLAGIHHGRHLRIELKPDGSTENVLFRGNLYYVGQRYYQLIVVGTLELADGAEADEFLRSLTVAGDDPFSKDPEVFTSPDGKFQARFPGPPQVEEQFVSNKYALVTDQGEYVIATSDYRGLGPGFGQSSHEANLQRLDEARDGLLTARKGKIIEQLPIKQANKYDGRFLRVEVQLGDDPNERGLYRGRMIVVGERLYEIFVVASPEQADDQRATDFLNSFVLKAVVRRDSPLDVLFSK